jgi:hypothetical protein
LIDPSDNLERLVSRYLDGECSPEERRQLKAMLRKDSAAEDFFEQTAALDREVGRAMRQSLGRTLVIRRRTPLWVRASRIAVLSAAACLAWLVLRTPDTPPISGQNGLTQPRRASWFAPQPVAADTLAAQPEPERPQVRMDKMDRHWIVVPGDTPGEFLVVEVKRVKTRTVPVQEDF